MGKVRIERCAFQSFFFQGFLDTEKQKVIGGIVWIIKGIQDLLELRKREN